MQDRNNIVDAIFVDSSALIALYNNQDASHHLAKVKALHIPKSGVRVVSSNFVIDETLTYLLIRAKFQDAVRFGEQIFEKKQETELVIIDAEIEKEAWQVFKKYNRDKKWSFTDCTSYVVMKSMEIKTVFTFDERDFRQMGFNIL